MTTININRTVCETVTREINEGIELKLRKNCNDETKVVATNDDGDTAIVAVFQKDGMLRLIKNVPEDFGFQVDMNGRIVLDSTPRTKNLNR